MGIARGVVDAVVASILPGRCAGCGRPAEPLCAVCAAGIGPPPRLPLPPGLDAWVAPFAYEGVVREVVARVKYRNERAAVPWLTTAMVTAFEARRRGSKAPVRPTIVTWAPASAARRRHIGFDHGELLARAVARRLRLPVAPLLTRDAGAPQTGRSRAARSPGPALRPAGTGARGRVVLLVDDVLTTGATLGAAAAALRRGGAVGVVALTAAGTPAPGG